MRKIIQKFMKQWPKQTMDVVVALYRENGPESIEFHGQIFTNKDLSQSPLFTLTIFPPLHVIPSLDRKYGGSANIISNVLFSNESKALNVSSFIKLKLSFL